MQASCEHCGTQHVLKDAEVATHAKVQFHCAKCARTTIVEIKTRPDQTMVVSPLPSFARGQATSSYLNLPPPDAGVKLPTAKSVMLRIVAGPAKGTAHKLTQARVILGRDGSDIPVNDPEISRHHCLLEVRESYANLKDLDSTNGTFYEEERVRAAMLQNDAEFRIGNTVIRFTLESK